MPPRASLALTRLGQDDQHVLVQARNGDELFELLQELGARVLLPHCSQTPKEGGGQHGGPSSETHTAGLAPMSSDGTPGKGKSQGTEV